MPPSVIRTLLVLSLLTLLFSAACYSTTLLQEPEPLRPGHVRGSFALAGNARGLGPEVAVRVGLPYDLEARGKLSVTGLETGINARVLDGEKLDLMVMPAYSQATVNEDEDSLFDEEFEPEHDMKVFALPVIARADMGEGNAVFGGPELRAGTRDKKGWFAVGGHLGISIDGGSYFTFIPECSLLYVAAGAAAIAQSDANYYANKALARNDWTGQCALGMTAGGRHADHK